LPPVSYGAKRREKDGPLGGTATGACAARDLRGQKGHPL
jgi:hypothetical protein